jgi:hypothetical protein
MLNIMRTSIDIDDDPVVREIRAVQEREGWSLGDIVTVKPSSSRCGYVGDD